MVRMPQAGRFLTALYVFLTTCNTHTLTHCEPNAALAIYATPHPSYLIRARPPPFRILTSTQAVQLPRGSAILRPLL